MNVLSLFDGMSCGQIALNRAGIEYENYFASEIDKYAIKITQHNYPDTIQLGDVRKVKGSDLPKIDLLIGGSPCQGFSPGGYRNNLLDERSKLFFEFVRLLNEINPKYFLLENVMLTKYSKDIFTKYLGVNPIEINSALVSAQKRWRMYWTNISNVSQPKDKGIVLQDIIDYTVTERKIIDINDKPKIRLLPSCLAYGVRDDPHWKNRPFQSWRVYYKDMKTGPLPKDGSYFKFLHKGKVVEFSKIEYERLQTVPDNYTLIVSRNQSKQMLGNGWTVDVIVHIFKGLNCKSRVKRLMMRHVPQVKKLRHVPQVKKLRVDK